MSLRRLLCRIGLHKRPSADRVTLYLHANGVEIPFEQVPEQVWLDNKFRIVSVFRCMACGQKVRK